MQPPGSIDNQHIHILGKRRLDAVIYHGSRVGTLMLADNGRAAALCPDFQLVGSGSAEGIGCHQHHLLAGIHLLLGNLADGGGLSHTIDTNHQNHTGQGFQFQLRVTHIEHIHQNAAQLLSRFIRLADVLGRYRLAQTVCCLGGGFRAQVSHNQAFFQLIIEIIVQFGDRKYVIPGFGDGLFGLCKTLFDFIKKSHVHFLSYSEIPSIWVI